MKLGIIVQARLGSQRLPGKVDLDFFDNQSILDIVFSNIQVFKEQYDIVLSTGDDEKNKDLEKYSKKYDVHFFIGNEANVLERFIDTAEKHHFTHVLRICSDNPFLQVQYLRSLIEVYNKSNFDYISFKNSAGVPVIKTHIGLFAEIVSVASLKEQQKLVNDISILEHVTKFIYENDDKFEVELLELPHFVDREDIRFTVDDMQDFENAQKIYDFCKDMSIEKTIEYIDQSLDIKETMIKNIKKYTK